MAAGLRVKEASIVIQVNPSALGRNALCSCGSGKKYKKCCFGKVSTGQSEPSQTFEQRLALAQHFVARRDFESASQVYSELLKFRDNAEIALAGLGQCLCQLNRRADGVAYLRKAGNLLLRKADRPGHADEVCHLIYQLIHWRALDDALALVKALINIAPGLAQARHLAALVLQGRHQLPEALAYASQAANLAPHDSNAQILAATLEAKSGNLIDSRQRLETIVQRGSDPNLARAHLELGVILDKAAEFDKAFVHLGKAGEIALNSPAAQHIDKTTIYRDIDQLRASFDPHFLSGARDRLAPDGMPDPVFLIGFYRSGSTLAEQILAAHPAVSSSDETHLIGYVLAELAKIVPGCSSDAERIRRLDSAQISHLRAHYWAIARQVFGDRIMQRTLVDKTTLNTLNIELINSVFPDAQVLFTVRDPRDICLSCITQSFGLSPLTVQLLTWQDTARLYAAVMGYWLMVRDSLSLSWTELRYEDVVIDLEGQFRPVFQKLGLDWSDACLAFYRHAQRKSINTPSFDQVTRPLYASSVGRWRNYQSQVDVILPTLQPFIHHYGY